MSSVYRLLCLNHDPALVVGGEWRDPEPAIAAALEPAMHDWLVEDHGSCELLVGAFSMPLVEVCCPASREKLGHRTHSVSKWMDVDWLRVLYAAMTTPEPSPELTGTVKQLVAGIGSCWSRERLHRLRVQFGWES